MAITPDPTRPGNRVRPARDTDRVIGQIQRGEVRAGPDAAREIAARAEAEYGTAWRNAPSRPHTH